MPLRTTLDVEEYATAATPFLEASPCVRNVPRWVIELARSGEGEWQARPLFMWAEDGGRVVAAAHWAPPYPLFVTDGAEAVASDIAAAVATRSHEVDIDPTAVSGPETSSTAVASALGRAINRPPHRHMAETLYELTRVNATSRPPGTRRAASLDELELLSGWLLAFTTEVGVTAPLDAREMVRARIANGTFAVWVDGGGVVSMSGFSRALAGVVRVGPVYTPPELRGRGYARRLVAEVSQGALDAGARRCMLFADVANPVSNSIYRQIGYEPGVAIVDFRLEP